jgi:hypothetical protein
VSKTELLCGCVDETTEDAVKWGYFRFVLRSRLPLPTVY